MRRRFLLAVMAALLVCGLDMSGSAYSGEREQTHFSAEDEHVAKPESLPHELKELLFQNLKTERKGELEGMTVDTLPAEWFSASVIHFGASGRKDWIVEGEGDQRGANICPFWVFISTDQGYRLAFFTRAHDLEVKKRRTHGYKDLEGIAATAAWVTTVQFRFDGQEYKQYRESDQGIR